MKISKGVADLLQNCEHVAGTPRMIGPQIREFCKELDAGPPSFLPVTPTEEAETNACDQNVELAVAQGMGTIQAGWTVWELDSLYLVAQRHAVLRTDEGLSDITPQFDGTQQVLFAPTKDVPSTFAVPCRYKAFFDHWLSLSAVRLLERNSQLICSKGGPCTEYLVNEIKIASYFQQYADLQTRRNLSEQRAKGKSERRAKRQQRTKVRR